MNPDELVEFKVTNRCKLEDGTYADRGAVVEIKLHNALRLTEAGCGFPKDMGLRVEAEKKVETEKAKEEKKAVAAEKVVQVAKKKAKKAKAKAEEKQTVKAEEKK